MTFNDLTALFLDSRTIAGRSPRTINWYVFMFKLYRGWLDENGLDGASIMALDIQRYISHVWHEISPNMATQSQKALTTLYRWAATMEALPDNPTSRLTRQKISRALPPMVEADYVNQLLASIPLVSWVDFRDRLLIQILFYVGLRVNEVTSLEVSDVDLTARRFRVWRKGGYHRLVPFPKVLSHPLEQWLTCCRPQTSYLRLFVSRYPDGQVRSTLKQPTIIAMLRRRSKVAQLEYKSTHAFRHGFALHLLEKAASTRLIQEMLGHAAIETTQRYLHLTTDLTQRMVDRIWDKISWPEGRIQAALKIEE